jgi:2-polyprenyl-3-methyl-5-hydroxy-6-metoxy-1,4-benzoquinol methylase
MKERKRYKRQKTYWDHAGEVGYGEAQFSTRAVEDQIMTKHWEAVIDTAKILGLSNDSTILELGCGDGKFSETVLANYFKYINAFDISEPAINRAKSFSKSGKVSYAAQDITKYPLDEDAYWDGAIMLAFLHHVKDYAPTIISGVAKVCPKVIVVEPNGSNIIRKTLELLPSYQRAGENSFKLKELVSLFNANQYTLKTFQRITFMPPFLPQPLLPLFKKLESLVESNTLLSRLCATHVLGFERTSD